MTKLQNPHFPVKPKLIDKITSMLHEVPIVTNKWRKDFVARFVVARAASA